MLGLVPNALEHDRVRQSYDAVAREYGRNFGDELTHKPLDRALLTALIEQTDEDAHIADLGCGPGHVAAWLAERGVPTVGIDLSPGMIEIAREQRRTLSSARSLRSTRSFILRRRS